MTRIALIRGSLLRAWELPNFAFGPEHPVDVFVSRALKPPALPEGIALRPLPSIADAGARLPAPARALTRMTAGSLERLRGLEDALDGYDIVHALELDNPFTLQAVRARRSGHGRRVVATAMENIPFRPSENRLIARRSREVAAGVDHWVAITRYSRLHLETAGVAPERITVLPLGIDMTRFRPADGPRAPGPLRVLTVARLERGKGVEDLAIAAGLLARRGIELETTFLGEGPSRARIERIAAETGARIAFASAPWEKIEHAYRAADVFVLASAPTVNWREQFGFAVIEAMACGLPVLAGDSGSLPAVVPGPESLVRPHDPGALAGALATLSANPELRARRGQAAREHALANYDERRIREQLLALYDRVLASPH